MKIDWRKKLSSRKLWLAVAGFVGGLIMAICGNEQLATQVSAIIMSGASVVAYILAEGFVDVVHKSTDNSENESEVNDDEQDIH